MVANVETLVNVAAAVADRPVTRKMLTIAGAVQRAVTLSVPIGTTYRQAIEHAGGLSTADPVLCLGGLMMGAVSDDLDTPVAKTATGVVVLPRQHPLMQRKLQPIENQNRIGKSACDQCRYCTELCPRYLLGYSVEPHAVMRSLVFTASGEEYWNEFAALCCSCGLCTLYACPEQLFPKEACDSAKGALRARNFKWTGPAPEQPHALREGRRIPIKSLTQKLAVTDYDVPAPFLDLPALPREVRVPLLQGAGVANRPLVREGDSVREGQPIGEIPAQGLGAPIHAPFAGRVQRITQHAIVLERLA